MIHNFYSHAILVSEEFSFKSSNKILMCDSKFIDSRMRFVYDLETKHLFLIFA